MARQTSSPHLLISTRLDGNAEQRSGPRPLPSRPVHYNSDPSLAFQRRSLVSIHDFQSALHVPQQREFDPYAASDIPISLQPSRRPHDLSQHPYIHNHQRTASGTSLPKALGDSFGYPQRGWSADDDRSLLNHSPMEVDDSMDGVYIAMPRDAATLGSRPGAVSTESLSIFASEVGVGENPSHSHGGTGGEFSPTLSTFQADPRLHRVSCVGIQSFSETSGWDDSTQSTHGPPVRSIIPNPFDPQPSPTLTPVDRSRTDIVNPARNDPARLFPENEPSAGRTTELGPRSVPSRSPTPRPSFDAAMISGPSSRPLSGHESNNNNNDVRDVTNSRAFSGYVKVKTTSGGTWNTDSSGVQSVFEPVQPPSGC